MGVGISPPPSPFKIVSKLAFFTSSAKNSLPSLTMFQPIYAKNEKIIIKKLAKIQNAPYLCHRNQNKKLKTYHNVPRNSRPINRRHPSSHRS